MELATTQGLNAVSRVDESMRIHAFPLFSVGDSWVTFSVIGGHERSPAVSNNLILSPFVTVGSV